MKKTKTVSKNKKIQPVGLAGEMRKKKKQIEARMKVTYAPGYTPEEYKHILNNWEEQGGMVGEIDGEKFYYASENVLKRKNHNELVRLKTTENLKTQIENLKKILAKRALIVKNHLENNEKVNDSISMINENSLYESDNPLNIIESYKDREYAAKQRIIMDERIEAGEKERKKIKKNNYTIKNKYIPLDIEMI